MKLSIVTWHGESKSLYYIVINNPYDTTGGEIIKTESSLDAAREFIDRMESLEARTFDVSVEDLRTLTEIRQLTSDFELQD